MKPERQTNPKSLEFDALIQRNVEAISRIEQAEHQSRTGSDIVSDAIAGFCGSPLFVWVHCVLFAVWLLWNTVGFSGWARKFDPPPFNMLTLVVSLEAIFLSTFILISQNRQQRVADQRNHLDLQINLLAEQETSRMLTMLMHIMEHLEIPVADERQVDALQQTTDPERVAETIQSKMDDPNDRPNGGKGK